MKCLFRIILTALAYALSAATATAGFIRTTGNERYEGDVRIVDGGIRVDADGEEKIVPFEKVRTAEFDFVHNTPLPEDPAFAEALAREDRQGAFLAIYWDELEFEGKISMRLEQRGSIDWGGGAPMPGLHPDHLSCAWSAGLHVPMTGNYSFGVRSDDGGLLRVGEKVKIGRWMRQPFYFWSGAAPLEAGNIVPLEFMFFEGGGTASMHLSWAGPGVGSGPIDSSWLVPTRPDGSPLNVSPQGLLQSGFNDGTFTHVESIDVVQEPSYERAEKGPELESLAWSGWLTFPRSGEVMFRVVTDGYSRMWLEDSMILGLDTIPSEEEIPKRLQRKREAADRFYPTNSDIADRVPDWRQGLKQFAEPTTPESRATEAIRERQRIIQGDNGGQVNRLEIRNGQVFVNGARVQGQQGNVRIIRGRNGMVRVQRIPRRANPYADINRDDGNIARELFGHLIAPIPGTVESDHIKVTEGERRALLLEVAAGSPIDQARLEWKWKDTWEPVPAELLSPVGGGDPRHSGSFFNTLSGTTLRDGSYLSGPILSADKTAIKILVGQKEITLPTILVANIAFRPLQRGLEDLVEPDAKGLLLETEEMFKGSFVKIEDGEIVLSSSLFGDRTYSTSEDATALVLGPVRKPDSGFVITLTDDSQLYVPSLAAENDQLLTGKRFPLSLKSFPADKVREIRRVD